MALVYDGLYQDEFIVSAIEQAELERVEQDTLLAVDRLGVTDDLIRQKMTICGVYVELAKRQLENEGMAEKLETYQECWDRWYGYHKDGAPPAGVSNMAIVRT